MNQARIAAVAAVAAVGLTIAAPANAAGPTVTVLATRLSNPRGVAIDGASVYVAEAGRGGPVCFPGASPEGGDLCVGTSGAVTKVAGGTQERVITGLVSAAAPDGSRAVGGDGIALRKSGAVLVVMSSLGPKAPPAPPLTPFLRRAVRHQSGNVIQGPAKRFVADIDNVEFSSDPNGDGKDSDPYGIALCDGVKVVADAGGNSLVRFQDDGTTSALATFPTQSFPGVPFPVDVVPTGVACGADGALFVSALGGFGTPDGGAKVWKVMPGEAPTVYATGLTAAVGIAAAPDGSLYVAQLNNSYANVFGPPTSNTGSIVKIPAGGGAPVKVTNLPAPGGVAVAADGTVYASINSTSPDTGRLVKIG